MPYTNLAHVLIVDGIVYSRKSPRGIQMQAALDGNWARYSRSLVSQFTALLAVGALGIAAQVFA